MALPFEIQQRFAVQATLGTGDTSATLKAAITGRKFVVTGLVVTSLVAAAQTLFVGDTSGTVKALSLAASITANQQLFFNSIEGLQLTVSEDLIVKPAAAGPSVHVFAEGYVL